MHASAPLTLDPEWLVAEHLVSSDSVDVLVCRVFRRVRGRCVWGKRLAVLAGGGGRGVRDPSLVSGSRSAGGRRSRVAKYPWRGSDWVWANEPRHCRGTARIAELSLVPGYIQVVEADNWRWLALPCLFAMLVHDCVCDTAAAVMEGEKDAGNGDCSDRMVTSQQWR